MKPHPKLLSLLASLNSDSERLNVGRIRDHEIMVLGSGEIAASTAWRLAAAGVHRIRLVDFAPTTLFSADHPVDHLQGLTTDWEEERLARAIQQIYPQSVVSAHRSHDLAVPMSGDGIDFIICANEGHTAHGRCLCIASMDPLRAPMFEISTQGHVVTAGPFILPCEASRWTSQSATTVSRQHSRVTRKRSAGCDGRQDRRSPDPVARFAGRVAAQQALDYLAAIAPPLVTAGHILTVDLTRCDLKADMRPELDFACAGADQSLVRASPHEQERKRRLNHKLSPEPAIERHEASGDMRGVLSHVGLLAPGKQGMQSIVRARAIVSVSSTRSTRPSLIAGNSVAHDAGSALVKSIAEAVERYSATRIQEERLLRARKGDLIGDAIAPTALNLYDEWQYLLPEFPYQPWESADSLLWISGTWLHSGDPVWLPAFAVYSGMRAPHEPSYMQSTTSGLAAASSLTDAARRAVFELVERDSLMMTWILRLPPKRITVDGALPRSLAGTIAEAAALNLTAELYLLQSDLDMPVVACIGTSTTQDWPATVCGVSANLEPIAAVNGAVLEMLKNAMQLRAILKQGGAVPRSAWDVRNFIDHGLYFAPASRREALAFLRDTPYEIALARLCRAGHPSFSEWSSAQAIRGFPFATVEITSSDICGMPLRVVRAIAPGLQALSCGHLMQRLANPRLRREMGEEMNLEPHPLA